MSKDPVREGKVFLVGAGPGDPGLLTLRGKACLEQADVVLYDNLANPVLLDYAPPEAERIYVGRCGRGAYVPQAEINHLILEKVRQGKRVVRLKGGDPFIFGRGGEEAEVVAEHGLAFEVVPGVTSAIAVPAYAGIPVTHRTMASTVAFVTGHEDPAKDGTVLEWPRLASADGTLVFLMGLKNLPTIVHRLLAEGKPEDTPVALIRWGSYPRQRTVVGTLADIVERGETEQVEPPTVIVIGNVVRLRERLNWFESRPLFGKRILVTRAHDQASALSDLLVTYGGEPVECPTLEIVPPANWQDLDHAIDHLHEYQWLALTSVNGVQAFMVRLQRKGLDLRALHGLRVCCIGPRTAGEVEKYGVKPDLVPSEFQAEGLIEAMKMEGVAGQRVLIPRAAQARELLPEQLAALGMSVHVVTAYRSVAPQGKGENIKEWLRRGEIHIITFASSSTVRNFRRFFKSGGELKKLTHGTLIACIGPITAQTVQDVGLTVDVVASENTIPALVETLAQYMQQSI